MKEEFHMRTLKKALCLVLVLAMVLTLSVSAFAVDKAADYKDYAKVENKEAVDVLTAIGVLNGNDDGTFGPEGNFTRAQAAKMIAVMQLGPTVANALTSAATSFNDVPATHWASGFIQYCVEEGIIAGYGDGKFGPNDTLTAAQWSKMLLVALGFDAEKEGLTGASWQINVTKLAIKAKIATADDLTGTFNRDAAAKLALAALFYTDKGTTSTYVVKNAQGSVLYKGTDAVTALLMKQSDAGNTLAVETVSTGSLADEVFKLTKVTDQNDAFGRPANKYNQATAKKNPIVVSAAEPVLTYTTGTTAKAVYNALGLTEKTTAAVYVDSASSKASVQLAANADTKIGGQGVLTEVYKVEDVITIVEINTYFDTVKSVKTTTDATTGVKTTTLTLKDSKLTSTELVNFAKKDAVLYTVADGKLMSLTAAESVTGVLSKVSTVNGADTFTVGGETYKLAAKATVDKAGILGASNANVGKNISLYVDTYGNLIASVDTTAAATASTFVKVLAAEKPVAGGNWMTATGDYTGKVYGILSDGSYGEYTVNYGKSDKEVPALKVGVYEYELNDAGEMVIENKTNASSITTAAITNGATSVTTAGGTVVLNSTTNFIFFTQEEKSAAVKTLSVKTGNTNSGYIAASADDALVQVVSDKGVAVAVFVGGSYVDPSVTADIAYVDASTVKPTTNVEIVEGKTTTTTVYTYTAYTADGEEITVTSKTAIGETDALYYYNTDKTLGKAVTGTVSGTVTVYGSTLKIGEKFYSFDAEKVAFVNETEDTVLANGQTVLAAVSSTTGALTHIFVTVDAPEAE